MTTHRFAQAERAALTALATLPRVMLAGAALALAWWALVVDWPMLIAGLPRVPQAIANDFARELERSPSLPYVLAAWGVWAIFLRRRFVQLAERWNDTLSQATQVWLAVGLVAVALAMLAPIFAEAVGRL